MKKLPSSSWSWGVLQIIREFFKRLDMRPYRLIDEPTIESTYSVRKRGFVVRIEFHVEEEV